MFSRYYQKYFVIFIFCIFLSELLPLTSIFLKCYFRTLKGGVSSGLQHTTSHFEPHLFRVKGRRNPVVRQMPAISWEHMNKGDVFIIDTKDVIFVWIGRCANNMEKVQAIRVSFFFKINIAILKTVPIKYHIRILND